MSHSDFAMLPCLTIPGSVSVKTLHTGLSNTQRVVLASLAEHDLSDDAFIAALLVVPLLDFREHRRIPDIDLRAACGFSARRWTDAINELVHLGALGRSRPRSPARRIPAFSLGCRFRPQQIRTVCVGER